MGIRPFLDSLEQPKPDRSDLIRRHLTQGHLEILHAMKFLDEKKDITLWVKLETALLMISASLYTVSKLKS
jgi:hypothetical protein